MFGHSYSPWWLPLAAFFLGFCLDILGERIAVKREADVKLLGSMNPTGVSPMILRGISTVVLGVACFASGYFYRDHILASNIFTRADLEVKEKYPAGNFDLLIEESGKIMHYNPCHDSGIPTPWLKGMRLREVRFEQLAGCKRTEYFSVYADTEGRIKTGEVADASR